MVEDAAENDLFMDKIRLSSATPNKESQLIDNYTNLLNKVRRYKLPIDKIPEYGIYWTCWELVRAIYDWMEFNKTLNIEKNKTTSEKLKERIGSLREIMNRQNDVEKGVDFRDLQIAYATVRELISLAGYHDDTWDKGDEDEWTDTDVYG